MSTTRDEDQVSKGSDDQPPNIVSREKSPFRSPLAIVIGLAIGWLVIVPSYRMVRVHRWKEQLRTAESFDEMRVALLTMMVSQTRYAERAIAEMADGSDLAAYDEENNTMLLIDAETRQPHTFSPGYSSRRPYLTGKFVDAQLVESFPDLSIFSAMDENNGKVTLFVIGGGRVKFMAPMTPAEVEELKTAGLWQAANALLESDEQ